MWNLLQFLEDLAERLIGPLLALMFLSIIIVIPYLIYQDIAEEKEWQLFMTTHDCKTIGKISGSNNIGSGLGIMANGQVGMVMMNTYTAGKTSYLCNDGITYWR